MSNRKTVLVCGESASGKTASLMNLDDPEGVLYLNCEAGKDLPFPAKFTQVTVTDPLHIYEYITKSAETGKFHTIIIDTLTYMMDMFESVYVHNSSDGRKAWGEYAQFFKRLMQKYVAESPLNIIFLAHTSDIYDEKEMVNKTMVKVKGSLMNQGVESYFNNVISTKKMPVSKLKETNDLLHITPHEEAVGFKYVYQTQLTKETVNERIRGPLQLWKPEEVFIDNDLQQVLNRLNDYYA